MSNLDIYTNLDTFISKKSKRKNFSNSSSLLVSKEFKNNFNKDADITLLKFDLNSIDINSKIERAELCLYLDSACFSDGDFLIPIEVYKVLTPYKTSKVTWNKSPELSPTLCRSTINGKENNSYVKINIIELVKEWIYNKNSNYGLALVSKCSGKALTFCSSRGIKGPMLRIDCNDCNYNNKYLCNTLDLQCSKESEKSLDEFLCPCATSFQCETSQYKCNRKNNNKLSDCCKSAPCCLTKNNLNNSQICLKSNFCENSSQHSITDISDYPGFNSNSDLCLPSINDHFLCNWNSLCNCNVLCSTSELNLLDNDNSVCEDSHKYSCVTTCNNKFKENYEPQDNLKDFESSRCSCPIPCDETCNSSCSDKSLDIAESTELLVPSGDNTLNENVQFIISEPTPVKNRDLIPMVLQSTDSENIVQTQEEIEIFLAPEHRYYAIWNMTVMPSDPAYNVEAHLELNDIVIPGSSANVSAIGNVKEISMCASCIFNTDNRLNTMHLRYSTNTCDPDIINKLSLTIIELS